MVLVAASDLLDFHLHRLRITLNILLLQCGQLRLHIGGILTSVVVHLLLHLLILLILILRTLHHWRQSLISVVHCICRQGAPLSVRTLLDCFLLLLGIWAGLYIAHSILIIDLHHVDFGQVVLHLLKIFGSFSVNHVKDVLDFVRAHIVPLVLRRIDSKRCLTDWREMSMLVCTCWHETLAAGVSASRHILTDTANLWQLELRLAVVALQALITLDCDDWLLLLHPHVTLWVVVRIWPTSHGWFVPPSTDWVVKKFLCLHTLTFAIGPTVENLYGLFIVSILIDMHYFLSGDLSYDSWSDWTSMLA